MPAVGGSLRSVGTRRDEPPGRASLASAFSTGLPWRRRRKRVAHHKAFLTHALPPRPLSAFPHLSHRVGWYEPLLCATTTTVGFSFVDEATGSKVVGGPTAAMPPARARATMESAANMEFPFSSWFDQILQKQRVCCVLLSAAMRPATIGAWHHSGGNGKSMQPRIASVPVVGNRQEKKLDARAGADLAGDRSCGSSRKTPDGSVDVVGCNAYELLTQPAAPVRTGRSEAGWKRCPRIRASWSPVAS